MTLLVVKLLWRRVVPWLCLLLACAAGPRGFAQTTVMFEGFEGAFPGLFWSVGDSNAANGLVYWNDVDAAFGGQPPHSGSWKGYCAGTGFGGTTANPTYQNSMTSTMARTINLAPYTRANLRFWRWVPSMGAGDSWRVSIDGTGLLNSSLTQANWTQLTFNLNSYAGSSRTLRFEFISDGATVGEGLYLDDIEVTGSTVPFTESFAGITLTNYTGYVIDADALTNDVSFNRESLLMNTIVATENFSGVTTNTAYQFTYRLRSTNGAQFPIYNFNGATNAALTYISTNTVSVNSAQEVSVTNFSSLRPAAQLSHLTQYRVEVEVARTNGVVLFRGTNGPFHFYHFTNTVSGDASLNTFAEFQDSGIERSWLIDLASGTNTFLITNDISFHRYDGFMAAAPSLGSVPVRLDVELRNATDNSLIPLVNSSSNYNVGVNSYSSPVTLPPKPRERTNTLTLAIRPASQLNSVDSLYRVIVRMNYTNTVGQPGIALGSMTNGPQRFLHFNGNLAFGDIETTFTSVSATPGAGAVTPGSHIASSVAVSPGAGTVTGNTDYHYGTGAPIPVNLLVNGNAVFSGGAVTLTGPGDSTAGNFRLELSSMILNQSGARANVNFIMPAGFGYNTNLNEAVFQKRMLGDLAFNAIYLNDALIPKSNLVFAASILATEETKPLWIVANQMEWQAANSRFVFTATGTELLHVRAFEYAQLQFAASNLFQTNMAIKLSNDRYFQFADLLTSTPILTADANGTALLSMNIQFNNGSFSTHFPYNTSISWTGGGSMRIVNDSVIPGPLSRLEGVGQVMTPYVSDCEGCSGVGSTNSIGLQPPNAELYFTRDGGLVSDGASTALYATLGAPSVVNRLSWGFVPSLNSYAQNVLFPTNVAFHMPGSFLRGVDNTASDNDGPGVMLFTGVASTNHTQLERPLSAGYLLGLADYAGMNVRVLGDNFRDGRSTIAGQSVNYKLRGNSKYYARLGGVSGIHSATGNSFPTNLTLLGYSFTFSNYSLAYLDSENVKSRTEGLLRVPYPSDFTLPFEEMKFTCPGGLLDAQIQGGTLTSVLSYWAADFEALSMQFVSNPGQECDPGTGWLVLGVRAWASHIADALHGKLGFNPNGTLIPKSQGVEGIDSRLQLPGNFSMNGPNDTKYVINPVGDAYYNKYDPARAPVGFITFAGKMNIPFFEDLKVQVQTSPRKDQPGDNRPVHLMGGWPRAGSGNPNQGWLDAANKDFFTAAYFDPDNLGFPGGVTLANYRNSPSQQYRPRAVKLWLEIVDFDYPLTWSDTLRSFKSFRTITNDLIVIQATHEVTYMDAKTAAIDFGIKYDGLPKISIANFLTDELGEALGVFSALEDAIGGAATSAMNAGLEGLNTVLADSAEKLIDELFDAAIDPLLNPIYDALKAQYDALPIADKSQFPQQAKMVITNFANQVSNKIYLLSSTVAGGGQLLSNIDDKIIKATNAICTVSDVIAQAPQMVSLVGSMVDTFASQFGGAVAQPGLNDALAEVQPSINQINGVLGDLKGVVGQLRGPLGAAGEWQQDLQQKIQSQTAAINSAMAKAQTYLNTFFNGFNYAVDNPFQHYGKEELKQKLRKEFKEEFLGTKIVADVQSSLKHRLFDYDAQFKQGLDSVFQQVNTVMRDLISQSLAGLDNTINEGLGTLSQYLGAGQISGHAVINGDALEYLRIDAKFEWKVPEPMTFSAYLEIKSINSENTVAGCTYAGGPATEVKVGADNVDLDWISPGLKVDVGAQFVIGNDGTPRGLGGKFQTRGSLSFGGFVIKQIGFAIAFGEVENYIAANVRASVGQSVEIAGGVYFGRSCSIDPLTVAVAAVSPFLLNDINPEEIFGEPPFTGAFVYAEGTFPIWSVGCLFEVRVTLGAGAWYFVEGPRYGGLIKAGVGGTVICVLSASGDITLIGSKKPEGMVFVGLAHVEGCFGPCPFCICVDTSTDVKYVEGKEWDAKEP